MLEFKFRFYFQFSLLFKHYPHSSSSYWDFLVNCIDSSIANQPRSTCVQITFLGKRIFLTLRKIQIHRKQKTRNYDAIECRVTGKTKGKRRKIYARTDEVISRNDVARTSATRLYIEALYLSYFHFRSCNTSHYCFTTLSLSLSLFLYVLLLCISRIDNSTRMISADSSITLQNCDRSEWSALTRRTRACSLWMRIHECWVSRVKWKATKRSEREFSGARVESYSQPKRSRECGRNSGGMRRDWFARSLRRVKITKHSDSWNIKFSILFLQNSPVPVSIFQLSAVPQNWRSAVTFHRATEVNSFAESNDAFRIHEYVN